MKKLILTLLPLFVILSAPAKADWPVADMNRQIDQTNFVVNSGCSGTLVDAKERYVLTANHCVENQYETVEIEKIDDKGVVTKENVRRLKPGTVKQIFFKGASEVREITYRTKLKAVDRDKDLALLQIIADIPAATASSFACDLPSRGESVYIVGNPMGSLYSSVVKGMVSSVQRDYGLLRMDNGANVDEPLIQISGGMVGGNSGGAVYDDDGHIVGVSVLGHRVNEVLGFAVPLDSIKSFMKANGVKVAGCEKKTP